MARSLLILPGDGVGPEVMREVRRVITWMDRCRGLRFDLSEDLVGGASIDQRGTPITEDTLAQAKAADAILFGSVGGPKWDQLGFDRRPEISILRLRQDLCLFARHHHHGPWKAAEERRQTFVPATASIWRRL